MLLLHILLRLFFSDPRIRMYFLVLEKSFPKANSRGRGGFRGGYSGLGIGISMPSENPSLMCCSVTGMWYVLIDSTCSPPVFGRCPVTLQFVINLRPY